MSKLKAYKYRLEPTEKQKQALTDAFGYARFAYNFALNSIQEEYKVSKTFTDRTVVNSTLAQMKRTEDYAWLGNAYAQSLQSSVKNLYSALSNRFSKKRKTKCGFPKFKSKHDSKQSFQYSQGTKVDFDKKRISIPKIGSVKFFNHTYVFNGKIKTTTITKTPTGKYFISILVETNEYQAPKVKMSDNKVGIDLGVKTFATLSDGTSIENPKFYEKSLRKVKHYQRMVSRRQKGSNRRERAKLLLAKAHERIANQRNDFLNKLTTNLVCSYGFIAVEDLNVQGMKKNHRLAQHIDSVSFSEFNRMLKYKAEERGVEVVKIDRFYPSSQTCSCCGYLDKEMKDLKKRTFRCPVCGHAMDRDLNASLNILNEAIRIKSLEEQGSRTWRDCKTSCSLDNRMLSEASISNLV